MNWKGGRFFNRQAAASRVFSLFQASEDHRRGASNSAPTSTGGSFFLGRKGVLRDPVRARHGYRHWCSTSGPPFPCEREGPARPPSNGRSAGRGEFLETRAGGRVSGRTGHHVFGIVQGSVFETCASAARRNWRPSTSPATRWAGLAWASRRRRMIRQVAALRAPPAEAEAALRDGRGHPAAIAADDRTRHGHVRLRDADPAARHATVLHARRDAQPQERTLPRGTSAPSWRADKLHLPPISAALPPAPS